MTLTKERYNLSHINMFSSCTPQAYMSISSLHSHQVQGYRERRKTVLLLERKSKWRPTYGSVRLPDKPTTCDNFQPDGPSAILRDPANSQNWPHPETSSGGLPRPVLHFEPRNHHHEAVSWMMLAFKLRTADHANPDANKQLDVAHIHSFNKHLRTNCCKCV